MIPYKGDGNKKFYNNFNNEKKVIIELLDKELIGEMTILSEVCENYTKSREKTLKSIKRISLGTKFHSFYLKISSSTYNDV